MRPESGVSKVGVVDADAIAGILNKFLRAELSAVETYRQAIECMGAGAHTAELMENKRSHEERVELLRHQIVRLGGQCAEGCQAWSSLTVLMEGGAVMCGEEEAIGALDEGEDHDLRLYRSSSEVHRLDVATRDFLERSLRPEQERTHRTTSRLKHGAH
jgi:hypothetical protein